ncbi:alanine-phosphoribitol ligase [Paraburkholderia sp. Ac-20340]|uniref:GMC family oxidoreductase n=1 Tax=Paraburkholderia sp. Ac-20340 TaxID=2703888 RepID=UPI00197CF5B7|nr:GMC family oxidoreductase N-terminal domain-containing protein [Paraburkholderia sp. Ac-20340]MBN3854033.1 alanine-phosphoribitol ligase [Paraburkholderia sp. Ac-20340]
MKNHQATSATYIVVGGGTTGCIVASRLSEDPSATVILIEEGPRDSSPYIRFPGTYYKTAQGGLLKRYRWEPTPGYEREENDTMVQASVLGGGSSVNGMVYVRGNPADYDNWEAAGARGWSYRDVLPYFRRAESNSDFANEQHGIDGPVGISFPASVHPLTRKWLQACQQSGLQYVPDFNGGVQDGCGLYQVAVKGGYRSSSASAYLRPAEKRGNLSVLVGAKVLKILVEKQRAIGVEYVIAGETKCVYADNEVIVSSGTINTPKLLMLSGIGHAALLERHGIKMHANLPGVGRNFQDHLEMSLVYQMKSGSDSYDKFKKLHWKAWAAFQYAVARSGPIASNLIEGGAFCRGTQTGLPPDLQYFFIVGAGVEEGTESVPGGTGCTLNFEHVQPHSRGEVSLFSANPSVPPRIVPNYMVEQHDVDRLTEGFLIGQEIMGQAAIRPYIEREHYPGRQFENRTQLGEYLRRNARAALHPVGTCRMGSDSLSVVDPELRVRGIDGLRIADASVMPRIPSGNTNAACTMIGEKASDIIRGRRLAVQDIELAAGQV